MGFSGIDSPLFFHYLFHFTKIFLAICFIFLSFSSFYILFLDKKLPFFFFLESYLFIPFYFYSFCYFSVTICFSFFPPLPSPHSNIDNFLTIYLVISLILAPISCQNFGIWYNMVKQNQRALFLPFERRVLMFRMKMMSNRDRKSVV